MARTRKTNRRTCRLVDSFVAVTPSSPRQSNTIVDTPRRVRLLRDAHSTAGKLPRKELFKAHNISEATGYRILKSNSARRGDLIHNRGRKSVLATYERNAIEAVEDASFRFASASHMANARAIGLANGSKRAIQRNMADHGVGTYRALQKKYIKQSSKDKRVIWGFERRRWRKEDYRHYRYSDECHFACGLQRQILIHRRRGTKAQNAPTKTQFRLKRRNQVWHVFAYIEWNFKSPLHFYTGAGGGGRLTQADYIVFLEEVIAPN